MKNKLVLLFISIFIISFSFLVGVSQINSKDILGTTDSNLIIRNLNTGDDTKLVALTFDDGPAPITHQFIDTLLLEDVPATFFVTGQNVDKYPEIIERLHENNFQIANHTNTHPFTLWMSEQAIAKEYLIAEEKIYQIIDERPSLIRAPYGLYPKNLLETAEMFNYTLISWDVDPEDWNNITSSTIKNRVLREVQPGSIIILHDGPDVQDRSETLKALPDIIQELKKRGYTFVSLNSL